MKEPLLGPTARNLAWCCVLACLHAPTLGIAYGGEVDSLIREGIKLYENARYSGAKRQFVRARERLDENDSALLGRVEQLLGAACLQMEDFRGARDHFGAAVTLAQRSEGAAHHSLARPWTLLAYSQIASGQRLEGAVSLAAAHVLSRLAGPEERADVYRIGSVLAASQGRSRLAYRLAEKAVALARDADNERLLADASFFAGKRAFLLDETAVSVDHLQRAQEIYRRLPKRSDRGLASAAQLYLLRARIRSGFQGVAQMIDRAREGCRAEFGPRSQEYAALAVVAAESLIHRNRNKEAQRLLSGLGSLEWGGLRSGRELEAYFEWMQSQATPKESVVHLTRSLELYEELRGYPDEVCRISARLARLHASRGNAKAALSHSKKAVTGLRRSRGILDSLTRRSLAELAGYAAIAGAKDVAQDAQRLLQLLRSSRGPARDALVGRAKRLAKKGKHTEAVELIDKIGASAIGSTRLQRFRAVWSLQSRKYTEAVRSAERILEVAPLDKGGYFLRAGGKAGLRLVEEAIADCTYALLMDPAMASALILRSVLLTALGQPALAVLDGDGAIAATPTGGAYFSRAAARLALASWDKAITDLETAFGLGSPKSAKVLSLIGDAHRGKGDIEAARRSYDMALRDNPQDSGATYRKGVLLFDLGDTTGAQALLERSTRSETKLGEAHLYLWLCRYRKKPDGDTALRDVLAGDSSNDFSHKVAAALLDSSKERQVLDQFSKLQHRPMQQGVLFFIGCARVKRGDVDGGRRCLKLVVALGPGAGLVHFSAKAALARLPK